MRAAVRTTVRTLTRGGRTPDPAKTASKVRRQVKAAGIEERRPGGGTLLTEPILVFRGKPRRELSIFDQDGQPLGMAVRQDDHAWKVRKRGGQDDQAAGAPVREPDARRQPRELWRCEIRDPDERCLLVVRRMHTGLRDKQSSPWAIESPEGAEIATLGKPKLHFRHKAHPIRAGSAALGQLRLGNSWATLRLTDNSYVDDGDGRTVARIASMRGEYLLALEEPLTDPLLSVVIATVIVRDETMPEPGGGG